ncbi:DUF58 domain-containing protein [soil metagenome]
MPGPPESTAFRSLYFSRVWLALAALVTLIGIVASNQSIALLGVLTMTSAGVSRLWNWHALTGVRIDRSMDSDRAFPGDIVSLTLVATNRKPVPVVSLQINEELSEGLVPQDLTTTIDGTSGRRHLHLRSSLRAYERRSWKIPLECRTRGVHRIGPVSARTGDPFGFFAARVSFPAFQELLVYPRVHSLDQFPFPARFPLGDHRVARHIVSDPLRVIGIRDYRPEDPFRSIHWKATARARGIQIKVQEPVTTPSLMILLNLDTFDYFWEGLDLASAEECIEAAASIAMWGLDLRYSVGLRTNGLISGSDQPLRVPVGRGSEQTSFLLTGLARVGAFSTVSFAHAFALEATRLPLGCTVVVVTSMMSDDIESQLASYVSRGVGTVLVPVGKVIPSVLSGLTVVNWQDLKAPVGREHRAA